ncbi:rhodanese-like domain-containing protein [Saprospiraceae bacterium]|nr:rhodanese-like domain-containing protein [Saprospiraceae bacterium]
MKYNLERKGITRDKEIIVYCQSGSRLSHTAFVLKELLDYPNVRNYDGSCFSWITNDHPQISKKEICKIRA